MSACDTKQSKDQNNENDDECKICFVSLFVAKLFNVVVGVGGTRKQCFFSSFMLFLDALASLKTMFKIK